MMIIFIFVRVGLRCPSRVDLAQSNKTRVKGGTGFQELKLPINYLYDDKKKRIYFFLTLTLFLKKSERTLCKGVPS